ncbi:MAG: HypC/HybG/HupF family hydrogenase formation chaperone [Neomegalonema sp.]|nr:HypC/HybG/HupF family hydrogenase formation chaperone [Neomegalonema sp.]
MCLAIPAKIIEMHDDDMATVALEGIRKRISLALIEDAAPGEYVLVHVGYALHKVSADEADRTLKLMAEAGVLAEELEEIAGGAQ